MASEAGLRLDATDVQVIAVNSKDRECPFL